VSQFSVLAPPHTAPSGQGHSSAPCAAHLPPGLQRSRSLLLRYGVALVNVALAVVLRELLAPLWGEKMPFLLLYPAVMVSAWCGGLGPGLLTAALCTVAAAYFWLAPFRSLAIATLADQVGLALAALVMPVIAYLTAALRWAQEQLERRVEVRTAELAEANAVLQAQVAARTQAETRYRIMTESFSDALYMVDAEGRITFCTPALERLSGYRTEELLGRPSLLFARMEQLNGDSCGGGQSGGCAVNQRGH